MKLSVVIPTLNSAESLSLCLRALGDVADIVVVDGGSHDETMAVAKALGARAIPAARGRGSQLVAGAAAATQEWLLFLHADTALEPGWQTTVARFMSDPSRCERAGVFRFALDDDSPQARRLERLVAWRTRWLGLPYGDQGLLIHRAFYDRLGGFRALPLMEDVDLIRRIGKHRLGALDATATTSARRWRDDGWLRRSARNLGCLSLYFLGVPPRILKRLYG
jgi:rSAM/selenodomain-associated transferase 2